MWNEIDGARPVATSTVANAARATASFAVLRPTGQPADSLGRSWPNGLTSTGGAGAPRELTVADDVSPPPGGDRNPVGNEQHPWSRDRQARAGRRRAWRSRGRRRAHVAPGHRPHDRRGAVDERGAARRRKRTLSESCRDELNAAAERVLNSGAANIEAAVLILRQRAILRQSHRCCAFGRSIVWSEHGTLERTIVGPRLRGWYGCRWCRRDRGRRRRGHRLAVDARLVRVTARRQLGRQRCTGVRAGGGCAAERRQIGGLAARTGYDGVVPGVKLFRDGLGRRPVRRGR